MCAMTDSGSPKIKMGQAGCRLGYFAAHNDQGLKVWHDMAIWGRPLHLRAVWLPSCNDNHREPLDSGMSRSSPSRGEVVDRRVSVPHQLQNSLATGVERETLLLSSRVGIISLRDTAIEHMASFLSGGQARSASTCTAP